ncbi:hypothetical protein JJB09_15950 [Rhizobium sp. KVB221]|uniref:Uncharacterized protein n=1 Tax=Rhizobium setariae TaxID=2801340 RepID=A0A937CQW2_9HYPH|nr:hypothetical protein [Rhizobium setariae]MBL0373522.1 hypothetical protein [Rhizobium setariae]
MSHVRPLQERDIGEVAALYQDTFLKPRATPSPGLAKCLGEFYLGGPTVDAEIPSLVHVDGGGVVSGFVGVNVVPMTFKGSTLKAAFCGALMVRDREKNPTAGARLLKSFLSGPQDLSLSETANKTSLDMARALRGTVLAPYSLEWMRILRPAAFGCDMVLRKSPLRKLVLPAARTLDRLYKRGGPGKEQARSAMGGLLVTRVDAGEFADAIVPLTTHYELRLSWEERLLRYTVREAFEKPLYGEPVAVLVTRPDGVPVGAVLYHLHEGGVGRVLQILARPGMEGTVVDIMLHDADQRGAAGLRGRTQQAFLHAMLGKGIFFANASSTIVFSRDEAVLDCFAAGKAFVNGLAGESWGRHIGGKFD